MKNFAITLAAFVLSFQVALADNVAPASSAKVNLVHNSFNYVNLKTSLAEGQVARVKFYTDDFALLHTEVLRGTEASKTFDISALEAGHYLVKVEIDGQTVYTSTINKVK